MKKIKIIFFALIILLITTCYKVNAKTTFTGSYNFANNYIKGFTKYQRYIVTETQKYGFTNKNIVFDSKFLTGGLLNKEEFEISNSLHDQISYLNNGLEFFTMTRSGNTVFFINPTGNDYIGNKLLSEKSGIRVTNYVQNNVKVKGRGTLVDPWEFIEVNYVEFSYDHTKLNINPSSVMVPVSGVVIAEVTPSYGFAYASNNCGAEYQNNKLYLYNVTKDITCRVEAVDLRHTLTANANGGTFTNTTEWTINNNIATKTIVYGEAMGLLPNITREGYVFAGWFTEETGGIQITENTIAREDLTIYARWIKNTYIVTLNWNLFDAVSGTESGVTKTYNRDQQTITLNGTWESNGLTLGRLYGTSLTVGDKYDMKYSYLSGSYTSSVTPVYVTEAQKDGSNYSGRTANTHYLNVSPMLTSGELSKTLTVSSAISDSNNFYFWVWNSTANATTFNNYKFKVLFTKQTTKEVTYGGTYGTLITPTKAGYTFDGWYTELSGGTKITSNSTVNIQGNHTLYARWTPKTYTLTYNNNGGSGCSTKTGTYNSTWGTLCTPTRSGYKFVGWYDTSATSGGTQITASTVVTENKTAYARWSLNKVTFTIKKDDANCTNCNGYTVNVSTSSSSNTASWSGTTTTSSSLAISGAMTAGTKYYVWVGEDSNHKSTMKYSGTSFVGESNATATIDFYTIKIALSNATMKFNGTSISNNGTVVALGTSSAVHAIAATAASGYSFGGWSSSSQETDITNETVASTTLSYVGGATTLTARGRKNVLSFLYNGNGGTWVTPTNDVYTAGADGYVRYKYANNYHEAGALATYWADYGTSVTPVMYNGGWFKFTRSGYTVPSGKEWYVKNSSGTKTTFAQGTAVTAASIATAAGCTLSSSDCNVVLYINWLLQNSASLSCSLKVSGSNVVWDSKTGATSYQINNSSSTPSTYSNNTSVAITNKTFYGHVKNSSNATAKCSISISRDCYGATPKVYYSGTCRCCTSTGNCGSNQTVSNTTASSCKSWCRSTLGDYEAAGTGKLLVSTRGRTCSDASTKYVCPNNGCYGNDSKCHWYNSSGASCPSSYPNYRYDY